MAWTFRQSKAIPATLGQDFSFDSSVLANSLVIVAGNWDGPAGPAAASSGEGSLTLVHSQGTGYFMLFQVATTGGSMVFDMTAPTDVFDLVIAEYEAVSGTPPGTPLNDFSQASGSSSVIDSGAADVEASGSIAIAYTSAAAQDPNQDADYTSRILSNTSLQNGQHQRISDRQLSAAGTESYVASTNNNNWDAILAIFDPLSSGTKVLLSRF